MNQRVFPACAYFPLPPISVGDLDEWAVQEHVTPSRPPRFKLSVSVPISEGRTD